MKRYFLPTAKFLQQLPTKKEAEATTKAPVENVVEVVTNELPDEVKETTKKNKKFKKQD
ncbi:MAG: hypothetical protein NC218_04040 [Acetobacter sp.]|nr:hypothetical protein [Acetobacter sp.]